MLSKDYRFFLECGVKIKEQGVYQGVKKDFETFGNCSRAITTNKVVFKSSRSMVYKLFWRYTRQPQNIEKTQTYYQVKEQFRNYVRNQKHRI